MQHLNIRISELISMQDIVDKQIGKCRKKTGPMNIRIYVAGFYKGNEEGN